MNKRLTFGLDMRRLSPGGVVGIALALVPALALTLHGQAFPGSIALTITDQSGAGDSPCPGQTVRVDANLKVGAVNNATAAQVIDDVPNVTLNPLFYAKLQNGVQPRNKNVHQH